MPKTIKTSRLYRDFSFARSSVNEEDRSVELSFSSEAPVERFFGIEILDHSPSAVRLGRLKDGGALLLDHDPTKQIGVVTEASIGSDRVGRAVVRFSKSPLGDEVFQDVIDGIRSKVSVGYQIQKMAPDGKAGETVRYRATDWEPFEISIVSIPADTSVGVGRDGSETVSTEVESEEEPTQPNPPIEESRKMSKEQNQVDVQVAVNEVREKELARIRNLERIGKDFEQHGGVELAREMSASGKEPADLQNAILERIKSKHRDLPSAEIGLTEKEVRQFSVLKALRALANPQDMAAREAAKFEFECGTAAKDAARKAGVQDKSNGSSIMIPADVLASGDFARMKRDLSVGTATAGGHTVAQEFFAGSYVDQLRNKSVLNLLGVTTLSGLQGNVTIPRKTSNSTAYWVGEAVSVTKSQQAFDQITMSPRTLGARTEFGRQLLIQSSIDVENMIRSDILTTIALEMDRVGLYGSGSSSQPRGLRSTTGISTETIATVSTPTWVNLVAMESSIAASNADVGNLSYVTTPAVRGNMKTTVKFSSTGFALIDPDGSCNGYPVTVSNQIITGDVWFANWSDLVIGMWGGLDLMVDPYTLSDTGSVRIVAMQSMDVACRHPESFVRGNTTANLAIIA